MKLARFLADLGSHKHGLGGGAAAALTGATGAALTEMLARLNDKRLKHSSRNAAKAAALRGKLLALIAKDAAAFAVITKAHASRKTKPASWQAALKTGVKPPLAICEACALGAKLAKNEKSRTSPWLESDRREALLLLKAAFESSKLNADINLKGIRDRAFVKRAQGSMKKWRHSL